VPLLVGDRFRYLRQLARPRPLVSGYR
jgi:hypothetical protein